MPYTLFRNYFPEVADRETRSITVLPDSGGGLPEGEYGFVELYCDERGCDCRRVFFSVIRRSHPGIQAVIAWGWEDFDFYAKWFQSDDADAIVELKGPILNAGSPATKLAPALIELVRDVLLMDPEYVERIKRHYKMFKDKVDQPRILRRTRKSVQRQKPKTKRRR